MFKLTLENNDGQFLTLTQNESNYQVISIEGLNPPPAQINVTDIVGMDGAKFNSSKLDTRNIVITVKINGDVEYNRQELYRICRTKEQIKCTFVNERRNVYASGYIDTLECDLFTNAEYAQISIVCMDPYFRDVLAKEVSISNEIMLFQFPFAIDHDDPIPFSEYQQNREAVVENSTEAETGALITVFFTGSVSKLEIRNTVTGESMELQYSFVSGDVVYIDTNKGQKSITLLRSGSRSNIFSSLQSGSTFLPLHPGENIFTYEADDGTSDQLVDITFTFEWRYRGV